MDMELFLQRQSVKYVPLLVAQVYRPNKHGEMKLKKEMKSGGNYGIEGLGRPNYKDWTLNDKLYKQYTINQAYIDEQYETRRKESQDSSLAFPELIFAHDTRTIAVLDFDHKDELHRPESQMLLQNTPYYTSLTKGLPKIMVMIDNIQNIEHTDRIVLHKMNGEVSLEILTGQFSYFRRHQLIYNADKPFYVYNSLDELFERFECDLSYEEIKPVPIQPRKVIENMNTDVLYTHTKQLLDRLIAVDHDWGNSYDNWVWVGFVLHNIFCDYDINMGLELFDYFSQSSKFYDADELEDKWEHIVRGAEHYTKQPATEHSLLHKIEELEENKGIPKPRLLCSSTDSCSLTSSQSSSSNFFSTEEIHNPFVEIEELLKCTTLPILQHSAFKKLLQKVIYNIDDTKVGYETYKQFLITYAKASFTDAELGLLSKTWDKTVSLPSHTIKQLVNYIQTNDPETFKEKFLAPKETYELVKKNFTGAKVLDPVCFVDIKSNGDIQIMRKQDMEHKYEHLKCMAYCPYSGKVVPTCFIKKWFQDENMKQYDGMDFNPDTNESVYEKNGMTYLNLFRGLECMDMSKYPSVGEDEMNEELELFLWLIRHQLCDENLKFYDCLIKLLAHAIQKAGQKWNIMVIFKSIQGIGKGMFCDFFGHCMIGSNYYKVVDNSDQILGHFNASRMNKLFIVLNELSRKDVSEKQGCLKGAITENTMEINGKGRPIITMRNEANMMGCTNHDSIPPEKDDRRLMPIESHAPKLPLEKALKLIKFLHIRNKNAKFIAKFRDYLLSIDLSDFVPERDRVITDYYKEMQEILTPHYISFIHHYFFVKSWEFEYKRRSSDLKSLSYKDWKVDKLSKPFGATELYREMLDYRREHMNDFSKYTQNMFGRQMKKLCSNKSKGQNVHTYVFSLQSLKDTLTKIHHMTIPEFDEYEYHENEKLQKNVENVENTENVECGSYVVVEMNGVETVPL